MKLLTINTHSLQEADPAAQLESLAQFLLREQPDVAALQEVSQSRRPDPGDGPYAHGGRPCQTG